ncbi:2,3-diaminopropionate biosynthesis protein SbnA [Actinokineospora bangkokensis]|uniref:2,3-diaminopropionate biosynthesis protein SbnA n=1 Tax=Actinokineospora bangkokensis TaxID=1193682 RepID=A0A1Q9LIV7_9PSEU|nr:2,3-diaminopropionate biosynthesis protein SbnA [Actinokineospora bangkokensis]OLR91935.1 2,3-diaminopropionate biosynthesis protein SbnA [Actinokineospora bangkokensis]
MPVITAPEQFNVGDLYVDLAALGDVPLLLKCEGFNFAGSVKLKAAAEMVSAAERDGRLGPGSELVESSSGNLGVALSLVARSRDLRFTCVTDARCTQAARKVMTSLGATVHVVTEPHPAEGLLGARIRCVRELCARDEKVVWLNQYANDGNWLAHYLSTGPEIFSAVPDLDVLFIGAGTTGTLMGCARYLREQRPGVAVIAVDTEGSVTFGGPPGTRHIPGLGTSVRPALLDESHVDDVVVVPEAEAVESCRRLAGHGFLFGGSTGTVVAGARRWLATAGGAPRAVAIAPDLGERYLDTIYDDEWVARAYSAAPWRQS